MKLTIEETIRGMLTGNYTHANNKPQQTCNYEDNYYGDKACTKRG